MQSLLTRIDHRHIGLAVLIAWGAALSFFGLLRFDAYGIDEGATRALLINWSVVENIAHPIVVFGMPDFRALLYVPLGLYWPGSIIAAKMMSVLVAFAAIYLLYRWSRRTHSDEVAQLAGGLALTAPIVIFQVDSLGAGPFLVLLFAVAAWIESKYEAQDRSITGWYFAHMLVIATMITLHPAGLAYPAALAIKWAKLANGAARRNAVWAGIGFTVVAVVSMQAGWIDLPWLTNPLPSLATALFGPDPLELTPRHWSYGLVLGGLLLATLVMDRHFLAGDLLGAALALGALFGAVAADAAWATVCAMLVIFRGIPCLMRINTSFPGRSFLSQRGLVFGAIFGALFLFMQMDRAHAQRLALELLPPTDELIRALAVRLEEEKADENTRVASQWPGRTMLATRHAALPLPPPQENGEKFLQQVKGLTHIMFAHNDPNNGPLARNIADISGRTETLELQPGGVLVRFRSEANAGEPATSSSAP